PENYVELMDLIAEQDVELLDIPGTVFSYCNECFCLLGAVIERASGMSYEDYVQENILKPAKLTNTGFFDENFSANENITKLYIQRNNKGKVDLYESTKWWDAPAMRATGLLRSTVNDYVRYSEIFT